MTTIAFCGAGMIATVHGMAARELGWIPVAVASRRREHAERLATQLGARAVEYGELPAGADIVVVATPPGRHAPDAIRMLESGAAVVLEKPLCRTLEEADRLVVASDAHGHRLLYAENLAYAPLVQDFVRRTRSLGPLRHLEVRALGSLPTWGSFTSEEWGGGALFDLGVHPLAVALLAVGKETIRSVRAVLRGGDGHGSDEHAEVSFGCASGLHVNVVSSWQAGPEPVWDAQAASETGVVRAEIFPAMSLEHNGVPMALPAARTEVAIIDQAGYLGQLAAFADDLDSGRPPMMDARFGRDVLELVAAAYVSAGRGGETVELPLDVPRDRTPLELWRNSPR